MLTAVAVLALAAVISAAPPCIPNGSETSAAALCCSAFSSNGVCSPQPHVLSTGRHYYPTTTTNRRAVNVTEQGFPVSTPMLLSLHAFVESHFIFYLIIILILLDARHQAITHYANMTFGTPAQYVPVILDTGSSNLGVSKSSSGSATNYFKPASSTTYVDNLSSFTITYGSGSLVLERSTDVIGFPGSPNITSQFGVITSSTGFFSSTTPYNGILGLAFAALAAV